MMAQVFGILKPRWETQIEFLASGFSLTQTQLSQAFGKQTNGWKMFPSSSLLPFQYFFKYKI